MVKKLIFIAEMLFIAACSNMDKPSGIAAKLKPLEIADSVYKKPKGVDCNLPDTLRTNCANIDFVFPVIKTGNNQLKRAVDKWTGNFLKEILLYTDDTLAIERHTFSQAIDEYYKSHETYKGAAIYGAFTASSSYKLLLKNDSLITFELSGQTYQGGAHGSTTIYVASFDINSGKQLTLDDIITDKNAFAALVEKKVKEERAEVFKEGFSFDDIFKFDLPRNYGLTKNGIYLHYGDYEIFPYAYGRTILTIPFSQLGGLLKHPVK